MGAENKNVEVEDKIDPEAKNAIEETISKLQRQNMLLGSQATCQIILNKILLFEKTAGSKSNNDHKRLIKDIKNFCVVGLSRKANTDGETEPIEETVQN